MTDNENLSDAEGEPVAPHPEKAVREVDVVVNLGKGRIGKGRTTKRPYSYVGSMEDPDWVCDFCLHPVGGEPIRVTPAVSARWDNMADRPTLVCEDCEPLAPLVSDAFLEPRQLRELERLRRLLGGVFEA